MRTWCPTVRAAWVAEKAEYTVYKDITMLKSSMESIVAAEQQAGKAFTKIQALEHLEAAGKGFLRCGELTKTAIQGLHDTLTKEKALLGLMHECPLGIQKTFGEHFPHNT